MKHAPRGPVKAKPPEGDLIEAGHLMERPVLAPTAQRCSARAKHSQAPCRNPAIRGGTVCRIHGGAAPQVKFAALERYRALQPKAVTVLETLLDRDEFPTVQIAAVREVMDRTEGKAGESLTVTGTFNVVEILRQRYAKHRDRL